MTNGALVIAMNPTLLKNMELKHRRFCCFIFYQKKNTVKSSILLENILLYIGVNEGT